MYSSSTDIIGDVFCRFDSSVDRGDFEIQIGQGVVIKGLVFYSPTDCLPIFPLCQ